MPTYLELNGEPEWGREFVPPSLDRLAKALRAHFNVGPTLIGCKGDNNHLRGYHRSDEWLANSDYCTNRTYSRSETPGNREPGDVRWICGMDIGGMAQAELVEMCRRVDEAVRSGRFEKITEWYGNLGGDLRVDGYNNIVNRLATSDSSHLTHLHLSFDRARANEDHTDLLAVLIGEDMTPEQAQALDICSWRVATILYNAPTTMGGPTKGERNQLHEALVALGIDQPLSAEELAALVQAAHDGAAAGAAEGAVSAEEIEAIVDKELDEQSRAGADTD